MARGDYPRAIEAATKLPEESEKYEALGRAKFLLGDAEEAQKYFKQLADMEANNVFARTALAYAYKKTDLDKAIFWYSEALRINSNHGPAELGRGLAHFLKGDLEKAIKDLEPLHNQKGFASNEACFYLGKAYFYQGEVSKAEKCFSEMGSYPQGDSPVNGLLAMAYWVKGDYPKAKEHLNKVLEEYPYPFYKQVHKLAEGLTK